MQYIPSRPDYGMNFPRMFLNSDIPAKSHVNGRRLISTDDSPLRESWTEGAWIPARYLLHQHGDLLMPRRRQDRRRHLDPP